MGEKNIAILIIISSLVFILLIINNESESFNFSLKYGVDGKNFVSTNDKTLKADTVEGIKTIDFEFTQKDLERIRDKIIELEIMEIDFREMPRSDVSISTVGIYTMDIELNEKTKTIYWTTNNASFNIDYEILGKLKVDNENGIINEVTLVELKEAEEKRYDGENGRVNRLFDLKNFIIEIINEYDEYKELPAAPMYL